MGGNMGSNTTSNMGNMSHQTVIHDGDHHNSMNSQFIKTTKTFGKTNKTHTTHLKFFKFLKVFGMRHMNTKLGTNTAHQHWPPTLAPTWAPTIAASPERVAMGAMAARAATWAMAASSETGAMAAQVAPVAWAAAGALAAQVAPVAWGAGGAGGTGGLGRWRRRWHRWLERQRGRWRRSRWKLRLERRGNSFEPRRPPFRGPRRADQQTWPALLVSLTRPLGPGLFVLQLVTHESLPLS